LRLPAVSRGLPFSIVAEGGQDELTHSRFPLVRAFNGNLQKDGWGEIGTLMVQRPLQSIPFILPQDGQGVFGTPKKIVHPFSPVVEALTINNKPMLLDLLSEARLMKKNRKKKKKPVDH
jgi:hypothetical protein